MNSYTEGVKPGGLTTKTETRILLCYILDCVSSPVTRKQIDEVLVGEELVNYFVLAESLSQLLQQNLIEGNDEDGYAITESGRTVANTLASDVPVSVRNAAVRGVILAQQYAAKEMAHRCDITKEDHGYSVKCGIGDGTGQLFQMTLYMPDDLSAEEVKKRFVENGDTVYKLVLATLMGNQTLAKDTLENIKI